jgi:hypothetical protein
MVRGVRFRVYGLECRVYGVGRRVYGLECRVYILFSRKLGGRFVDFYSKIPAEACVKSRFVLAESGGSPNGPPETGFKLYLGS